MSKHTPGPWSKNKFGEVVAANGELVRIEGVALSGLSTPETRANRDLFFAAPEMLAALIRVADLDDSDFDGTVAAVRKAIARAKGESS